MELTPKQKREIINSDLNKYLSSKNDFVSQRQSFIDLNYSLALAYEYDTQKAQKYLDDAKEIQDLKDGQDKRATIEKDEDNGKNILIPHNDDMKFKAKFEKENLVLFRQLENELELMHNEARLYEKIKDNKDKGIDKLTPLYVELQEGQIDAKRDYEGKPIDAERFRHSYANTTKFLEEKVEKWAQKENKKEQGMEI